MTKEQAKAKAEEIWANRPAGASLDHIVDRIARALLEATAGERERAAKTAAECLPEETEVDDEGSRWLQGWYEARDRIAAAIRALGEQPRG